jgi:Putative transmembrane protein (PGPGW)
VKTGSLSPILSRTRTLLKLIAGFALLVIGGVLSIPGIPGPGILLIIAGLWLLRDHFPWAGKALAWAKERMEQLRRRRSRV